MRVFELAQVRDGKAGFVSEQEALEAVGLAE